MSLAKLYSDNSEPQVINKHVWACLLPMTKEMKPVDLFKPQTTYHIGRNSVYNSIVFPGYKISNRHAEITWDGKVSHESSITITDFSTNGTFVNGVKLGRGISHMLTDGAEIAFASTTATGKPFEDYRYVFRHMASGANPKTGFFALYNLGNLLDQDSFSSVSHCIDLATGISWAAKIFYNTISVGDAYPTSRANKMISREISVLQQLSHPNICFLKDTFVLEDERPVLVMELIEGSDLLEHILSNLGVNERMAQHLTYQLCLALSYVHGLGIVHRDLKPENVLLTTDNPPNVKVGYFGIANASDKHSMMKTICGIPAHVAPEVVQQTIHQGYDHLIDSWGMGTIVFSMLTNRSPFMDNESVEDIRDARLRQVDWKALSERSNNPQIFSFIKALLANDPKSRMTLTDALDHPWLQDYVVRNGRVVIADRALGEIRGLNDPETDFE